MKYFLLILSLLVSFSSHSEDLYLYDTRIINEFLSSCACPSKTLINCTKLIEIESVYMTKFGKDKEDKRNIYIVTNAQIQNDIRYHNNQRDNKVDLNCYSFLRDGYKHDLYVVDNLKNNNGWRE